MHFYSIWPSLVCMAVILALISTPLFRAADTPPSPQPHRLRTMDGLRGFLAFGVYFHHVAVYHGFLLAGDWQSPPTRFYYTLGPLAVSIFFMITGYLFWSKLMQVRGRPAWLNLYIGRVFRIGPLYLAVMSVMLLYVFVRTGFSLHVPVSKLSVGIAKWLSLGLFSGPDINGYLNTYLLIAGVTWSIRCEWIFYLCLPILALAARKKSLCLPLVITALAACFVYTSLHPPKLGSRPSIILASHFLAGMLFASLHEKGWYARLQNNLSSVVVLALVAIVFQVQNPYTFGPVVLLGTSFYLITSGCTVFGLLTTRPAIRLGDISYGIYLLQGFALAAVFRPAFFRHLALSSPINHWSLALVGGIVLICIATVGHLGVERPGIALGRLVSARLEARLDRRLLVTR